MRVHVAPAEAGPREAMSSWEVRRTGERKTKEGGWGEEKTTGSFVVSPPSRLEIVSFFLESSLSEVRISNWFWDNH